MGMKSKVTIKDIQPPAVLDKPKIETAHSDPFKFSLRNINNCYLEVRIQRAACCLSIPLFSSTITNLKKACNI
jgi:hypothetical protein